jgi:hypothetical protein
MSERLEVLVAYRWRLTAQSSFKLSENFSSFHRHWMQRRGMKWRDAYKHFVTSTVHASCASNPRNKTQLDMSMWKTLHVLIPKTWYNIKWLWPVCWPQCIETNVSIFTTATILYINWSMYTTHHSINLKAQQITRLSSSGSDRIIIMCCMFCYIRSSFYFECLQQELTLFFFFSRLLFLLLLFFAAGFRFNIGTTERIIRLNSRLIEIPGLFLLLLFLARLWKGYKP